MPDEQPVWNWEVEGTRNRHGSGATATECVTKGTVPGEHAEAFRSLSAFVRWDAYDPDESITITLTPREVETDDA